MPRAFDLPAAILLHLVLGIMGLTLMGLGALIVCFGAVGAGMSGIASRFSA